MARIINNLGLLAMAGVVSLASCSKDDNLYQGDETLKQYEENWKATFGDIDPAQDWSMATRGSVTVSVPKTTDVEIYVKYNGEYKCVGNYSKVSGSQTLEFDMPKGCENLLVKTKAESFKAKVGSTIDFGDTRAIHSTEAGSYVTVKDAETEIELTSNDVFVYREKLPESGVAGKSGDNRGKEGVKQNFYVASDGTSFTIYPIYWQTSQTLTLGIYYYNDGVRQTVPVYTIREGSNTNDAKMIVKKYSQQTVYPCFSKQSWESNSTLKEVAELVSDESYKGGSLSEEEHNNVVNKLKEIYAEYGDNVEVSDLKINNKDSQQLSVVIKYYVLDSYWSLPDYSPSISNDFNAKGKILSKGINVTVPTGTNFGFYISRGDNKIFYSQARYNMDPYYTKDGTKMSSQGACHAAFYKADNGKVYLGFEDWEDDYGDSDMDLNDLIVRVDGIDPTDDDKVIDEDATTPSNSMSWIIVCEDLGDTDDYDFNDVVVRVSHVSGETTATITPLAAGGTLPATIYFNGKELGEIHRLISASYAEPNASGSYTMLNTNANGGANPGEGQPKTVPVASDFSLAPSDGESSFGGFSIKVQSDDNEAKTITAPKTGKTPQMFMVDGTWKWPVERASIEKAYTSFSSWVGDANNTDWQTTKNASLIYGN